MARGALFDFRPLLRELDEVLIFLRRSVPAPELAELVTDYAGSLRDSLEEMCTSAHARGWRLSRFLQISRAGSGDGVQAQVMHIFRNVRAMLLRYCDAAEQPQMDAAVSAQRYVLALLDIHGLASSSCGTTTVGDVLEAASLPDTESVGWEPMAWEELPEREAPVGFDYQRLAQLLLVYLQHVLEHGGRAGPVTAEGMVSRAEIQEAVISSWRKGEGARALLPGAGEIPMPLPDLLLQGLEDLGFVSPRAPPCSAYRHGLIAGGSLSAIYAYCSFLEDFCLGGGTVREVAMLATGRPFNAVVDSPTRNRICPEELGGADGDTEASLSTKVRDYFAREARSQCPWRQARLVSVEGKAPLLQTLQTWVQGGPEPGKVLIVALQPALSRFQLQASRLLGAAGFEVHVAGPAPPRESFRTEPQRANDLLDAVANFVQEHRMQTSG